MPFADLHHCGVHDLSPGKPPESKLNGGEDNEDAQSAATIPRREEFAITTCPARAISSYVESKF